ncbi:MAG: HEAT repeat domain-containing protein [Phycisphaerae bacterium]
MIQITTKILLPLLFLVCVPSLLAEETRIPYLDAVHLFQKENPQTADIQRQIVLLNAQTRLTPDWLLPYRQLIDIFLQIGRLDQALIADQKYMAHQNQNAFAQLQRINIELPLYQTAEARRQFLEQAVNDNNLLPEVISEIYYGLAQIAWQNYENERAKKYLEFAIKRVGQNLKAYRMLRMIAAADKNAGPIQNLYEQIRETQAMVMVNPLDAQAVLQMAILAGKAGLVDQMQTWRNEAEDIRKTFTPDQNWPDNLKLDLAESLLAVNQPKKALALLLQLLPGLATTTPATKPATDSNFPNEIRARILIMLSAQKFGSRQMVAQHRQWLDQFAESEAKQTTASPDTLALASIFYSVYGDELINAGSNPILVLTLAQKAVKIGPENPAAKIALAIALAKSGVDKEASKLIKDLDQPANPFIMLTQIFIHVNKNQLPQARELLVKSLANSPCGPLRDALLNLAPKIKLNNPPTLNFAGIEQLYKQFDPEYFKLPPQYQKICKLDLASRGDLSKGQSVELTATLTNLGRVALTIGPDSTITPECVVEIQPVPSDNTSFFIYIPIEARQILSPNKTISQSALLGQAVSPNSKLQWDRFIANHKNQIKQVSVQAKVYTTVMAAKPVEILLAQSASLKIDLPKIDRKSAASVTESLKELAIRDPWDLANLAHWHLLAEDIKDQHPALVSALVNQLQKSKTSNILAASAWALRFAPNPDSALFNALGKHLNSKDPLTRLMVLDTLGQLQGKTAQPLFQVYAVKDPDNLVRQLSAGYLLYRY